MGKYMRKAKTRSELALMDLTQSSATPSSFGVRTRAKTLALQRLQKSQPPELSPSSGSYLQLRSRRLEKPPISIPSHVSKRSRQHGPKDAAAAATTTTTTISATATATEVPNPKSMPNGRSSSSGDNDGKGSHKDEGIVHENADAAVEEASFGENVLDFEGRERSTRESTPCSLIRDQDTVRTPGSTTRPTCSTEAYRRTEHATRRQIPTASEMDEFFAGAEEAQQRKFIEKYNFDPVNEKPLPGRYEWEKLKS